MAELVEVHRPARVVADLGGPTGALGPELVAANVAVEAVTLRDLAAAVGSLSDTLSEGRLIYRPHPALTAAAERADWRKVATCGVRTHRRHVAALARPPSPVGEHRRPTPGRHRLAVGQRIPHVRVLEHTKPVAEDRQRSRWTTCRPRAPAGRRGGTARRESSDRRPWVRRVCGHDPSCHLPIYQTGISANPYGAGVWARCACRMGRPRAF